MYHVFGVLAGILWGGAAALLNGLISRRCMKKNSSGAMAFANVSRWAVDILALSSIFLLRGRLPFSYEAALIAAAASIALLGTVLAYRLSRPD